MIILPQPKSSILNMQPYQPGRAISEVQRELGIRNIIKLASNENPLGCSPDVSKLLHENIGRIKYYPDGNAFELKKMIAKIRDVQPTQIILGNGSDEIFTLILMTFGSPQDSILISEYAFAAYAIAAKAQGMTIELANSNGWDQNLDNMLQSISDRTKIIFLANPNNPTATWHSNNDLRTWLEKIPSHIIVVIDQAYFEYMQHLPEYPDAAQWLEKHPNLIVTHTFSKAYGLAALRLGYGLCSPQVASLLNRVRLPFNANSLAQVAGIAALSDQKHLMRVVNHNLCELEIYKSALSDLGVAYFQPAGNFITIQIPKAQEVCDYMLHRGIIVRPLIPYGMSDFLRISVGTRDENLKCMLTLEKSINALKLRKHVS